MSSIVLQTTRVSDIKVRMSLIQTSSNSGIEDIMHISDVSNLKACVNYF